MSEADDAARSAIREFELKQERRRVELQQRAIEALRARRARNAPRPRTASIGPAADEAKRAAGARPRMLPANPAPGWPSIPMPKSPLPPPAGLACHSLAGAKTDVVAFAVFGLDGAALERAVANVAERQRLAMNFVPLFLTDSAEQDAFRRRGYGFEYFPKAAYGAAEDAAAFRDKLLVAWKKWGAGSLIDLGASDYLQTRVAGTNIPELAAAIQPVEAKPTAIATPKSRKPRTAAQRMERKLWAGFSRPALRELETLKRSPSKAEQCDAAWAIARWYGHQGEHQRALDQLALMRAVDPKRPREKAVLLLETESLVQLGRQAEARSLLDAGLAARGGFDSDLCLAYANTYGGFGDPALDRVRLSWVNRVFREAGFVPIEKRDAAAPLFRLPSLIGLAHFASIIERNAVSLASRAEST
jgi:hypothetical protein